jgi:hypothetical protein
LTAYIAVNAGRRPISPLLPALTGGPCPSSMPAVDVNVRPAANA